MAPWSVVQLAGPFSNQPATMARPLLALTALGAGLGFVAPSVGRGAVAPRSQASGTALKAALDGGSWAPLGNSDRKVMWESMGSRGYGLEMFRKSYHLVI